MNDVEEDEEGVFMSASEDDVNHRGKFEYSFGCVRIGF